MKFSGKCGTDTNTISGWGLWSPERAPGSPQILHTEKVYLPHLPQTNPLCRHHFWLSLSPSSLALVHIVFCWNEVLKYLNRRSPGLLFPINASSSGSEKRLLQKRPGSYWLPSHPLDSPLPHQGTQGKIRHGMMIPGHV